MGINLKNLDTEIVDLVEYSFNSVLKSYLKTVAQKLKVENITFSKINNPDRKISGMMPFVENHSIVGTLSVGFPSSTASNLFSRFYGTQLDRLDDYRIVEGVAEITNVIHGIMKEHLNANGHHFEMCLPSVVLGPYYYGYETGDAPALRVTFDGNFGELFIEIVINSEISETSKKAA